VTAAVDRADGQRSYYLQHQASFNDEKIAEFVKHSCLETVCASHGFETRGAMYEMLARIYDAQTRSGVLYGSTDDAAADAEAAAVAAAVAAKQAAAEAPTYSQARLAQLSQHIAALRHLCFKCQPGCKPLTADMILRTHRLLMQGQDNSAGSFRSRLKLSDLGWIYIDAKDGLSQCSVKYKCSMLQLQTQQ
jgi:hypothetical protein